MTVLTSYRKIVAQDQALTFSALKKTLSDAAKIWAADKFIDFVDGAPRHFFLQQMPAVIEDHQF